MACGVTAPAFLTLPQDGSGFRHASRERLHRPQIRSVCSGGETNHWLWRESNPSRPFRGPLPMLPELSVSKSFLHLYNVGVSVPSITAFGLMEYLLNKVFTYRTNLKESISFQKALQIDYFTPSTKHSSCIQIYTDIEPWRAVQELSRNANLSINRI